MSDPAQAPGVSPRKGLRICLVTPDINGPVRNGGIGTACEAIARIAAEAGHDVTILYSRNDYTETAPVAEWVAFYAARGITLVPCPPSGSRLEQFTDAVLAWNVWRWLKGRSFDLIYLVDNMGAGFFVAMARFFGLAFQETCLVAGTHAPTMWHLEGNRQLPTGQSILGTDYMERMTIEHADAVISPSRHMVEWMQRERWTLPQHIEVVPNPVPFHARPDAPQPQSPAAVSELVFFGRLEPRKGIVLFARAVSMLPANQLAGLQVTFLGKRTSLDADRLARSVLPGTVAWRIIDDMAASEAVAYLKQPGRAAVIASLMENAPMTVVECLGQGIPFLASAVGGIPELLHEDDRTRHLFRPEPPELARVLSCGIAEGIGPARPATGPAQIDAIWRAMLPDLAGLHAPRRESCDKQGSDGTRRPGASHRPDPDVPAARAQPDISVVLVHRNRPRLLQQAIHGLKQQTFTNFEVILVDDGSTKPDAIAALDRLDPEFRARGWRIIRQENKYLGAARNTGWRAAKAPYVLFHDDDNICMPHHLATMLGAARRSGADVLTSSLAGFHGESEPGSDWEASADAIWVPLGGCQPLGLYENCFGDAHALVLRTVLEELGGFSEDFGTGHEDWELFARAALGGYKVWSVPEPLFWYRIAESSMLRGRMEWDADFLRSARPYLSLLETPMRQAFLWALASGQISDKLRKAPPPEAIRHSVGQALTLVSQSSSISVWRAARRLGLASEADLSPSGDPERDFQRLLSMTGSVWWDLAAPIRLLGRLLRRRQSDGKRLVRAADRPTAVHSRPASIRQLIYDIGMHNGSDTEFYLRKGFDVIAIEANPDYVARARQRFDAEIGAGRLTIYDVALTDAPGEVAFFVHEHDDWSRMNLAYDDRFAEGTYREVKVRGMPFSEIARRHPQPYYAKLDIEGPERMVIEQMFSVGIFPPFLSFEVNSDTNVILDLVSAHGYEDFQLLAQRDKSKIRLPNPPLEGTYYEARFDGYMSGPFGRELPGPWVSAAEVRATLEAHNRKIAEGASEDVYKEWFDVHARRRDAAPRGFL